VSNPEPAAVTAKMKTKIKVIRYIGSVFLLCVATLLLANSLQTRAYFGTVFAVGIICAALLTVHKARRTITADSEGIDISGKTRIPYRNVKDSRFKTFSDSLLVRRNLFFDWLYPTEEAVFDYVTEDGSSRKLKFDDTMLNFEEVIHAILVRTKKERES
jgi:hypothetical protein